MDPLFAAAFPHRIWIFVTSYDPMDFGYIAQLQGLKVGVFAPSNTATQHLGIRDEMLARGLIPTCADNDP